MPERLSVSEFKDKYDSLARDEIRIYKNIRDEKDNLKYFYDTFKEDADIQGQPWWKDLKQKKEDLEKESMERTDEWNNTDKNDKEKSDEVYERYAKTMKELDEVTRQIDSEAKEHKDQTIKLLEERLYDKYDLALASANYNLEQIDEEMKQIKEETDAQVAKLNSRITVVQNRLQENLKFMQNLDRDSDDYKKRSRIVEKYNNELKDKLWPEIKNLNQEKDKKVTELEVEKDEYNVAKTALVKALDYLGKKKAAVDKTKQVADDDQRKAQGQKLANTLGAAAAEKQEDNDKAAPVAKPKKQPAKRPVPVNRKTEKVEPTSKAKIEINAQYGNVHFQPKDSETRFTDDIGEYFGKGKAKEIRKACFEYLKDKYGEKKLISRFDLRGLNPAILSFLLEFDDMNNDELLYKYVYDKKNLPLEYIASIENPDTSKLDDKTFIRLNRQILRDNKYFGTNFKAIPFLGLKTFLSKLPGLKTLQSSQDAVKMLPSAIKQKEEIKADKEVQAKLNEDLEKIRKQGTVDKEARKELAKKYAGKEDSSRESIKFDRSKEEDELFEDMLNVELVNTEEDKFYNIVNGKEPEDGDEPIEIPMEKFLKGKDDDDRSR